MFKSETRGIFFGLSFLLAFPNTEDAVANSSLDDKMLSVTRTGRRNDVIDRGRALTRLDELLQARLRIGDDTLAAKPFNLGHKQTQHEIARRRQPLIEVDCADDRLEGLSEKPSPRTGSSRLLAAAQEKQVAKTKQACKSGKGLRAHESGPEPGQRAFGRHRVLLVEIVRDDECDDCITEVFEALVRAEREPRVLIQERAVNQRLFKDPAITKAQTKDFFGALDDVDPALLASRSHCGAPGTDSDGKRCPRPRRGSVGPRRSA